MRTFLASDNKIGSFCTLMKLKIAFFRIVRLKQKLHEKIGDRRIRRSTLKVNKSSLVNKANFLDEVLQSKIKFG